MGFAEGHHKKRIEPLDRIRVRRILRTPRHNLPLDQLDALMHSEDSGLTHFHVLLDGEPPRLHIHGHTVHFDGPSHRPCPQDREALSVLNELGKEYERAGWELT